MPPGVPLRQDRKTETIWSWKRKRASPLHTHIHKHNAPRVWLKPVLAESQEFQHKCQVLKAFMPSLLETCDFLGISETRNLIYWERESPGPCVALWLLVLIRFNPTYGTSRAYNIISPVKNEEKREKVS